MILPSKHVSQDRSLLGIGALLLEGLDRPQTVTSLWERVREEGAVGTFERFVLGLDMLYIIGALSLKNGLIERVRR
jgi:hypothetical protein